MGLRFRKSKKFGPLRINLSGSGVGWSVGGKHFRYTQPAKGKAYTTTTIPGTGISSRSTVRTSPSVGEPSRIPIPPIDSPSAPPSRSGTLRPLLIGLLTGGLIIAGVRFAGSLSGYTDENMIPPPPDRTVSAPADPETTLSLSREPLSSFGIKVLENICVPVDYASVCDDPDIYADEDTYIYVSGRIVKELYSIGEKQMLCLAQDDNPEKLWFCSYSTEYETGAVALLPGDLVTIYGQFLEILTLKDDGTSLTLPYIAGFHVLPAESNNALSNPAPTAALSAPETEKIPETTPPEDPAPTEIPAGVVTVEKEQPAETTLEEWFALMEERTRHTPAYPEEDETTLDEWFAKVEAEAAGTARWYTVNTSTKKIHNEWCKEVQKIKPENIDYTDTPGELLADGYTWCEKCHRP